MDRLVVLLRGINVGKAKQVPMAALRDLLTGAGYEDVRTVLRSGNAVVETAQAPEDAVGAIEGLLVQRFGFSVDVVVRTSGELSAVLAADPFAGVADDPSRQLVAFLGGVPNAAAVTALRSGDHGEEGLHLEDRELHLWCPGGLAESPLGKAIGKTGLGVPVTMRNWRTVTKLEAMARGDG